MHCQGNLFRSTRRLWAKLEIYPGYRSAARRARTRRSVPDESSESGFERYICRSWAGNQYTRPEELRAIDVELQSREDSDGKSIWTRVQLKSGYWVISGVETGTRYTAQRSARLQRLFIHPPRPQRPTRLYRSFNKCDYATKNDTYRCRLVCRTVVSGGNVWRSGRWRRCRGSSNIHSGSLGPAKLITGDECCHTGSIERHRRRAAMGR